MIATDPNIVSVELVAAALGDLCDELVLVGGCAASLLIDAPAAPPPRVTVDVDLIATVTALRDYHAIERRLAARGLTRDLSPDAPICRWKVRGITVDLMSTDERVLGFSNRWYGEAARTAAPVELPSGRIIKLISAPAFLGTKFEAFKSRGNADALGSHDFEDIINVVEGRTGIVEEIRNASATLRSFLASEFSHITSSSAFADILPGLVAFDELHEQRIARVAQRVRDIAALR